VDARHTPKLWRRSASLYATAQPGIVPPHRFPAQRVGLPRSPNNRQAMLCQPHRLGRGGAACAALVALASVAVPVTGINTDCPNVYQLDTDGQRWSLAAKTYGIEPEWRQSTGFDASLRTEYEAAFDLISGFLGKYRVYIYLFEPKGADEAYTAVVESYCTHIEIANPINDTPELKKICRDGIVANAKAGTPSFVVAPNLVCTCKNVVQHESAMFMSPSPGSLNPTQEEMASEQAHFIHEYFHVYRGATTPLVPAWMGAGTAVLLKCLFASTLNPAATMFDCLHTGGGRSGIVPAVNKLYAAVAGSTALERTSWLKAYGEDRKKINPLSKIGNGGKMADGSDYESHIYYDAGAAAMLFAADRSATYHKITRVQALANMFQSTEPGKGLFLVADAYKMDTSKTGDASQVPEGAGWRKAFAAYTGDDTTSTFYIAFDNFAYADKDGATIVALAPSDPELQVLVKIAYQTDTIKNKYGELTAPNADATTFPNAVKQNPCAWPTVTTKAPNSVTAAGASSPGATSVSAGGNGQECFNINTQSECDSTAGCQYDAPNTQCSTAAVTAAATTTKTAIKSAVLLTSYTAANCAGEQDKVALDPVDGVCRQTGTKWNKYMYTNGATSCRTGVSIGIFRGYASKAVCDAAKLGGVGTGTVTVATVTVDTCVTDFATAGVDKSAVLTCASAGSALHATLAVLMASIVASVFV